jgi:hypothetical protein
VSGVGQKQTFSTRRGQLEDGICSLNEGMGKLHSLAASSPAIDDQFGVVVLLDWGF